MDSVPFIVDLGLSTVQGILRLENDGVVIDWRPYTMLDEPPAELWCAETTLRIAERSDA
jgi:hypothetical protein